ncbi:MAG: class I tRNA ligase family protein [Patescibacteria group bacterium]
MAKERFDHKAIEQAAQKKWEELDLYTTDLKDDSKDPYYLLFEFPYPSGDLHIGHWYAFALTDIFARYQRMQGKNVLFPIGFDAFGLPAENAAIKHGIDPKKWTYENMDRMREQIRSMGTSVDWTKEVVTSDPAYYKWTQWLFLKFFEQGLAERRNAAVKWCPNDKTVLANEQVMDGRCERCGHEVEEKNLTQWFLTITKYADRLLRDLDPLPWREEMKEAQRAWIGESEGAKLSFPLHSYTAESAAEGVDMNMAIEVFTTRPDTLYGATYVVLAPEHPLVETLLPAALNADEMRAYRTATSRKTERERQEEKDKTGVLVGGIMAINPATNEPIPVYLADYVLVSYGTGAVMAVPAHDERDFEFAQKFGLPMKQVVVTCADDPNNPPQEGFPDVKRDTVIVHLRDTATGKFALLDWHGSLDGITTAIMGGVEEGQTPVEAALAEISEEAAIEGVRIVKQLPWITAAKYCASHKSQNRCAHTYAFLAEIDGLESQGEIPENEQALHTLVWVDESAVLSRLTPPHQKQMWQLLNEVTALTDDGYLINSGVFDGRSNREALWDIVAAAGGERVKNYRLRDWLVSRQRYWGCPIPVVYDPEGIPHAIPAEHLPWLLPEDVDFTPGKNESPLASSTELKERVTNIFGEGWTPEYDTLDTFVDSSWYYLRYLDPADDHDFTDQSLLKKWLPVDRYSGGSEHTTMHLLYSRFFHKALYDLALVPTPEPFNERFNRGLILGPDGAKMSKSKGNVINPDDFVAKYGADAVRMYLAFIGPYNEPGNYPWNLDGVEAMRKFLDRINALSERLTDAPASDTLTRALGIASAKVGTDTDRFKFNTAISALMVALKEFEAAPEVSREAYRAYLLMLAPFAPHLAEHLYEKTGGEGSVHEGSWPEAVVAQSDTATIIVQVNGKKRGEIMMAPGATEEEALHEAMKIEAVIKVIGEQSPQRTVYVPGRILNIVVAKA